jgi:hypothetical protein
MAVKKDSLSTLFGQVEVQPETKEGRESSTNLWTFVNSISEDKSYAFDENTAREYTPFTVNRAFSIHIDTLHHAAVMNQCHGLDKKMQHDYLFYSIPKKVRRKKWLKRSEEEKKQEKLIEDVAQTIGYSYQRAKSVWRALNKAQQSELLALVYPNSKNEGRVAR